MKKNHIRILCCILAIAMTGILMAGCGGAGVQSGTTTTAPATAVATAASAAADVTAAEPSTSAAKVYDKFITVDVFDNQANYQGVQGGWFGDYIKKKFNMELNIIAPNVAGGGDTLFQTRSAAGNLGDLIMIGSENGRLADTVKAGLLLDMTNMVNNTQNVKTYTGGMKMLENLISSDKVYAIPSQVSNCKPTDPSDGPNMTFGPLLRWDLYQKIGSPQLNTLEDLLPALQQMQKINPKSDSNKKVYGMTLFKDWDGNMMCLAKQPACMYGVDECGFLLLDNDSNTTQSIINNDSLYIRALKFYYQANQLGLLDPDSTTQNFDSMQQKVTDGAVLWTPWPWVGMSYYNTKEHTTAGKGFMFAPVKDMKIFSYGCNPDGNKYCIGIGSKAQDPQRMMDFIDWMYSPEGVMMSCAQTTGACGPEGVTWEMKDGRPTLTEFGRKVFNGDTSLSMPAEWGGGNYKDGISQLNYQAVSTLSTNPVNSAPYNWSMWPSTLEANNTPLDKSWQSAMNAVTVLDYLTKNNMLAVGAGNDYIAPASPADIDAARNQCKAIIIQDSWKMCFAKNEAQFNSLLKHMQDTVKGLGYDKVLAFDQQIANDTAKGRQDSIAAAGK